MLKTLYLISKGSIGHAFAVRIRTENRNQASFCPFTLREVSVLAELALGHLRYRLTDVPPQSNSPPDIVFGAGRPESPRLFSIFRNFNFKFSRGDRNVKREREEVFKPPLTLLETDGSTGRKKKKKSLPKKKLAARGSLLLHPFDGFGRTKAGERGVWFTFSSPKQAPRRKFRLLPPNFNREKNRRAPNFFFKFLPGLKRQKRGLKSFERKVRANGCPTPKSFARFPPNRVSKETMRVVVFH